MLKNAGLNWVLVLALAAGAAGCSKDPEVAKKEYFDSGNRYFAEGKFKEAIVEFRNAVQQDQRFGEARLKLADAYVKENDPRNAFREYVRAADLLPNSVEAQTKAATFLMLAQQYEDAKTRAEKALALDPKNVEAQVLRANAMAGLKDLDGAVTEMEQAIKLDPAQASSYANLGQLQLARGNAAEAEQAFKKAIETDPKSVVAHLALANFYWSANRREEAEAELEASLALDPKHELANRAMATFLVGSGRAAEAEPYAKALADISQGGAAKLALADYYIGLRRDKDALAVLARAAEDKASWAAAQSRVAAIQYASGQKEAGQKTIDEVLAKEPKNVQALLVKSRFLLTENKLDEALVPAKSATAADPNNAEPQFVLGSILAAKSDVEGAAAAMKEVLRLNPRATAAQVQLARLELARGQAASSVQYAEQAASAAPNDPTVRLTLARTLMGKGDLPRAEAEMKQLLAAFPNAPGVHSQYGLLLMMKKDVAGAQRSFDKALELNADDFDAFRGRIGVDLANKQFDQARARVEGYVAKNPKNAGALTMAARAYASMGDVGRTEQMLRQAIDADPARIEAYGMLGQLYLSQKKLDQAIVEFDAIGKRQPKNVGAPTMVAMILQMQGKNPEALKRYEDVMQIDSRAPVAANNLAWMYAEGGGNLDVALRLAQVAKEQLPDVPEVNDTLGFIYLKKDLANLAVPPLQAAIEKDPQNPTYRYRLGVALARTGDKASARRELQQALKMRPDFPEAADARKVLADLGAS